MNSIQNFVQMHSNQSDTLSDAHAKELKEKWNQFRQTHQKPDCVLDQYLPLIDMEYYQPGSDRQIINVVFSQHLIEINYEQSFSFTRYVIFVLGTLELVLNVTFNQGALNIISMLVMKWNRIGILNSF